MFRMVLLALALTAVFAVVGSGVLTQIVVGAVSALLRGMWSL